MERRKIILPQDQSNRLNFSIEESVWFQKGQEVSELLSISLEPDITIREHDQYVSIKGVLELAGEYKMLSGNNENTDKDPIQFSGERFIHEVVTREDGITELAHRFPVDITIPKSRVANLEDIYVTIETFDYDFPEERCLKLMADISIFGIKDEKQREQENEMDEVETNEQKEEIEPIYRHKEDRDEKDHDEPIENVSTFFMAKDTDEDHDSTDYTTYTVEAKQNIEQENELRDREKPKDSMKEEEAKESPDDTMEEKQDANEVQEIDSRNRENQSHIKNEVDSQESPDYFIEVKRDEESLQETREDEMRVEEQQEIPNEQDEENAEIVRKNDNTLYLTKLFTRDDEEEFSKLKMCIVQQGETLEEICERYDITVQQLIRFNHLGADPTIYEGQILYIPVFVNQ